jgi:hypothetical protein
MGGLMSIELGAIISVAIAIITGVYGYGRLSSRVETNKEVSTDNKIAGETEHANIWNVINNLRRIIDEHLKDYNDKQLALEKEMGSIRGNMSNLAIKLDTILEKINDIKVVVEKLENK